MNITLSQALITLGVELGGGADQGVEEVGELGGGVAGEAAVDGAGLDDGGSGRGEPAEALAERAAGQRAFGAGPLERRQGRAHRIHIGRGIDCEQPGHVQLDLDGQVAVTVRVHHDADVDGLAPLYPGDHTNQRMLEDLGPPHRWITSGTIGARRSRCSTQASAPRSPNHSGGTRPVTCLSKGSVIWGARAARASASPVARSRSTCSRASNGRLGSAVGQLWWKYSAAPWSISQMLRCQTRRFGLRQVRSTLCSSASNHKSWLAKPGSAVQPSGSKPTEPGRKSTPRFRPSLALSRS